MTSKSSIQLIIFYMQSKEMFKLTPQLCRLAKTEFHEKREALPSDVKDDVSFNTILKLIDFIEIEDFASASEILGDAYKEYDEMISYFPTKPSKRLEEQPRERALLNSDNSSYNQQEDTGDIPILQDNWEPPRPGSIPTPPEMVHKRNEDDSRNWGDRSPVITRPLDPEDKPQTRVTIRPGGGDGQNEISQYMTTLRPRDGKLDYERVYVSYSPAVLADRFMDLHKSDWKAAQEELTVVLGDKQAVRHMLWIIAKSSIICANLATQQLQDLENSAVGIMVSQDPLNRKVLVDDPLSDNMQKMVTKARTLLIDYRHEISKLSVPRLQREIRRAVASELGTTLPRRFTGVGNHFIEYASRCIELIWLMYVHDPPMHLEWLTKEQEGCPFKTELYEAYTRPGTVYDYCVWPVVRMYRNGPVLRKGVAQGR